MSEIVQNISEFTKPETLNVIDDNGNEVEIPQSDYWMYEWDAQPNAITFEEFEERGEKNG